MAASAWTKEITEDGEEYYFNAETDEVQWDPPAEWNGSEGAEQLELDPEEDPANWEEVDGDDGVYYFNTVTEESVWDEPSCLKEGFVPNMARARASPDNLMIGDGAEGEDLGDEDGDEGLDNVSDSDRSAQEGYEFSEEKMSNFARITQPDAELEDICKAVEEYSIEEFAEANFNYERSGLRSQSAVDKILCWSDQALETALIIHEDKEVNTTATQLFQHVLSYMQDRKSSHSSTDHAIAVINILFRSLNSNDALTDEVCMQICKQTTNNPSYESNDRGWTLLLVVMTCFSPSQNLMPYLLSYCVSNMTADIGETARLAKSALIHCPKSFRLGRRMDVPAPMELEALRSGIDISIRVNFIDGRVTYIIVNSWTTIADAVKVLARKIGCLSTEPYWLFEVEPNGYERLLTDTDRVLDIMSSWFVTEDGTQQNVTLVPSIVFKVAFFFDISERDVASVELYYLQVRQDMVSARYPQTLEGAFYLAALCLQDDFGDHDEDEKPPPFRNYDHLAEPPYSDEEEQEMLSRGLSTFLNPSFFGPKGMDAPLALLQEIEAELLHQYAKLAGMSSFEARSSYLDYLKASRVFGAVFFNVEPQNTKVYPTEAVLGINPKYFVVIDPTTQEYLSVVEMDDIVSFTSSATSFIIVIQADDDRQDRRYFRTNEGSDIGYYLTRYRNEDDD